ncbi:hypothetical protein [Thalassiella azotivora]
MTAVLMTISTLLAAPAWWVGRRTSAWVLPLLAAVALAGAALAQVVPADLPTAPGALTAVVGVVVAVVGGGPVTVAVLRTVSGRTDLNEPGRHEAPSSAGGDIEAAGEVLRGGAWIGALERAAIVATLATGWPEGLAVVLAVKGLGRYPELRQPGAAERFIIGTFTSVLWAAACAGVISLALA